jgi:hypothetical protein
MKTPAPTHQLIEVENTDPVPLGTTYMAKKHILTRIAPVKKFRVWWIPQVPMKPFYIPVNSLEEARLVLDTLAIYDLFQLKNNIKPDYCNVGGLQSFETDPEINDWCDWYDEESGESFNEYCQSHDMNRATEINDANGKITL